MVIGLFIGYFVAKVGIPSFVVTLGLFLGFQGLQLVLLGDGNTYRITEPAVTALENSNMPNWGGWVMWAVIVLVSLGTAFYDRRRRQAIGVPVRTISLLVVRVAVIAVAVGIVVALLNQNRSVSVVQISGVPIVVPIVVALLWIGTQILDRTRWGLHLYAVGGNPEAARRAGINVAAIRISAFVLCSTLAILSGLFQASQVGVVGSSFGQTDVLNGIAAAVVGGVSLFGGRGRLIQGVVGALVITAITNGLGLLQPARRREPADHRRRARARRLGRRPVAQALGRLARAGLTRSVREGRPVRRAPRRPAGARAVSGGASLSGPAPSRRGSRGAAGCARSAARAEQHRDAAPAELGEVLPHGRQRRPDVRRLRHVVVADDGDVARHVEVQVARRVHQADRDRVVAAEVRGDLPRWRRRWPGA